MLDCGQHPSRAMVPAKNSNKDRGRPQGGQGGNQRGSGGKNMGNWGRGNVKQGRKVARVDDKSHYYVFPGKKWGEGI